MAALRLRSHLYVSQSGNPLQLRPLVRVQLRLAPENQDDNSSASRQFVHKLMSDVLVGLHT